VSFLKFEFLQDSTADKNNRYSEILDYHNVDTNGDPSAEAHGEVPRAANQ
jgi:hypothetical protein